MKKIFALAVFGLFTTGLFAGGFALSDENLKQADKLGQKLTTVKTSQNTKAPAVAAKKISKEESYINGAMANLKNILADKESNSGFIFQGIANVMDAWNDAKKTITPIELAKIASAIEQPLKTGFGNSEFVLSQYINMEVCVIASRSVAFAGELEAFGEEVKAAAAAQLDIAQSSTKEEQYVLGSLGQFKSFLGNMQGYHASHIMQATVGIMDAWQDAKKVLPKATMVKLAKAINQPCKTGFSTYINPAEFAFREACIISSRSPSLGAQIEAFGEEVMTLAK